MKSNDLKDLSKFCLGFGFIISIVLAYMVLSNFSGKHSTKTQKVADGFTIENYNVILDVNENNSINVKENITVNFYERGHHGIYRFIPEWLEYTNKNNKTKSRKAKISNFSCYTDNYIIDTVSGKKRIQIGNASQTLPIGPHTYTISYTYDMGQDPYKGFDEFIFHTFGDYWGTRINNASVQINLPKTVNINNNIHFFADKYRKKDITSYVNYNVSGNTIFAEVSPEISLDTALTVDLELPDKYFVSGTNNYGNKSFFFCLICIVFAIISFFLWIKNGKDLDKVPETVEFYPPEQLDAAQIGYIYKKDTGRKLSIALIIELANKGFIKIIESEDKTTQTIVKSNSSDINKAINREIKISKLADYKSSTLSVFSPTQIKRELLMKEYFPDNKTEYVITDKFDDFYNDADNLIKNNYIKIEYDSINKYSKEELEQLQQSLLDKEFKNKPQMTKNEELVYNQLFKDSDETILSENHTFYQVFTEVSKNVSNEFEDKINDQSAYKSMAISSFLFLIATILWFFAYCIFEDLNTKLNYLYSFAAIANVITFIFSILMERKTSYGEQLDAKIKGFRNYLEIAEKNQIDALVEENPNYFYDILPYAYVLDVSKKWIEKFEKVPIPTNDMGNFNYCDINSLDTLSSSIYYPSSSSSSSGCGGGCSSCGGGCSSCGGGGSW